MQKILQWCAKNWTLIAAGIGYLLVMALLYQPAKKFFGEEESEEESAD